MKRLFSLLLVISLLLAATAYATGDSNIDGGGGNMGQGGVVGDSAWNPGDDGVRVSIMQGSTAVKTFDLSNVQRTRTQRSFRIRNKLYYKNGGELSFAASYTNLVPPSDILLPRIIPSNGGGNNIDAIRNYFTDERVVHFIASKSGIPYERLISGDYKLMLEPIAYFKYNGVQYAMTATEAALFDVAKSNDLYYQMSNLTHKNLPLAMFLENGDLGIAAWTGSTSARQTNIDILNKLGVGIVNFHPAEIIPDPPQGDYVYHCDTDVITAALVPNRTGNKLTPYAAFDGVVGYATFQVNGQTYEKQMVCPVGSSQYMWLQWHTPSEPCELEVLVTPPGYRSTPIRIPVSVVKLEEKTPPDPGYDGPGEGPGITHAEYRPNFEPSEPPDWGNQRTNTWQAWTARIPPGFGNWVFAMGGYEAELEVDFRLEPDEKVPTAVRRGNQYIMGSGYGVDAACGVTLSAHTSGNQDITGIQNALAVFPEFNYTDYDRILQPDTWWYNYRTTYRFKKNPFSYYDRPVHFIPVWYPDGEYTVQVAVFDVWTPGGQLYATVQDSVEILGSMYDDWYIRVY